jgi:hypothetical protein
MQKARSLQQQQHQQCGFETLAPSDGLDGVQQQGNEQQQQQYQQQIDLLAG